MRRSVFYLAAAIFVLFPMRGQCELMLTAEVTPTIGLPGFETYRITATSDLGNIVGFDFSEIGSYGVFGQLNQVNPFGQSSIFPSSNPFFGAHDLSQDSQFLLNADDLVSLFSSESPNSLHSVFAVAGEKQQTIGNSVPFLQVSTPAASSVSLKGMVAILKPNNEIVSSMIDVALSGIHLGPAPQMQVLPVPEPIQPPVHVPESILPPSPVDTPISGPVQPPIQIPDLILPPSPIPVTPAPNPAHDLVAGQLFLTAEVMPTVGLEGFQTYRITATSNLGNVVGFDFSEVGSYGVLGPMNQVHAEGQKTVFSNGNALFGAHDPSQDTQFLMDSNDVVALFTDESEISLHGVFAIAGEMQATIGNSVPFLQITTSNPAAVSLRGALSILRFGEYLETHVAVSLSDIPIGPAPELEMIPMPAPILEIEPTPPLVLPPLQTPPEVVSEPPIEDPIDIAPDPPADSTVIVPFPRDDVVGIPGETVIEPIGDPFLSRWDWAAMVWVWDGALLTKIMPGDFSVPFIDTTAFVHPDLSLFSSLRLAVAGLFIEDNSAVSLSTLRAQRFGTANAAYVDFSLFGSTGASLAATQAPEPSAWLLLILGSAMICPRGRRHAARRA